MPNDRLHQTRGARTRLPGLVRRDIRLQWQWKTLRPRLP